MANNIVKLKGIRAAAQFTERYEEYSLYVNKDTGVVWAEQMIFAAGICITRRSDPGLATSNDQEDALATSTVYVDSYVNPLNVKGVRSEVEQALRCAQVDDCAKCPHYCECRAVQP